MQNYDQYSRMYQEVRVRRIFHKWWAPRVQLGAMSGKSATGTALQGWSSLSENNVPINPRGGDMVWFCTKKTGPVVDQVADTLELDDGLWLDHTAYGFLKRNPRYRKRCVFRNNVAYGMRPVVFKFRPTMLVPRSASKTPVYNQLLSVSGNNMSTSGVLGLQSPSSTAVAPYEANAAGWTLKPMGWIPTLWPGFGVGTHPISGTEAPVVASAGNRTSADPDTLFARTNRWHTLPLFGMFHGMQPQTAQTWPRNLRQSWSMQVEFRKPRIAFDLDGNGNPNSRYFREWGMIPNTADPNIM